MDGTLGFDKSFQEDRIKLGSDYGQGIQLIGV